MATKKIDYTALYNSMLKNTQDSIRDQYGEQAAQLQDELPRIKGAYDAQRSNIYTNARLSAIGNNEALAANGLAGNLYSKPTSGYSETSRVAENNNLRRLLAQANMAQRQEESGIESELRGVDAARRAALAQAEAQHRANLIAAQQYEREFEAQQKQQALENAYTEISIYGKVITPESAAALNVPIGTSYSGYTGGGYGGYGSYSGYNYNAANRFRQKLKEIQNKAAELNKQQSK